jgi:hypothetical protein
MALPPQGMSKHSCRSMLSRSASKHQGVIATTHPEGQATSILKRGIATLEKKPACLLFVKSSAHQLAREGNEMTQ